MVVIDSFDCVQWLKDGLQTDNVVNGFGYIDDDMATPYIIVYDIEDHGGGDDYVNLVTHSLTIYRYTVDGERDKAVDQFLQSNGLHYRYQVQQYESGEIFEEVYDITNDIYERK